MAEFRELGIDSWLIENLKAVSIKSPTPIQIESIPKIMQGRNLIASAETGSGKTIAFALPILQSLGKEPFGIYALILTPTRELAFQIAEQLGVLGRQMHLKYTVLVGGFDQLKQQTELENIPHILVATPARLVDMYSKTPALQEYLENLKVLVLDEADRIIDGNMSSDLDTIISHLPTDRQTLLFSATMTTTKQRDDLFNSPPVKVDVGNPQRLTVGTLKEEYLFFPESMKEVYLVYLLQHLKDTKSLIIFVSRCIKCHTLSLLLEQMKINNSMLHSKLTMSQRLRSLNRFKEEKTNILICTDVGSRGLDIPQVDLVINYDLPRDPKDYVHRVGRTARAGRGGMSISMVTQYDIELVHAIEEYIGKQLQLMDGIEESKVILIHKEVSKAMKMATIKMSESGMSELFEEHYLERKKNIRKTKKMKGKKVKKQIKVEESITAEGE